MSKVMLLPSIDGDLYSLAVIPPPGFDDDSAAHFAALKIIEQVHSQQGDEEGEGAWTYEDIHKAFEAAGWVVPHTIQGPQWDEA